jgi:hypothetical protein
VTVEQRPAPPPAWSRPDVRIGAVIAVALAVAFIVWLLVRGGGDSTTTTSTPAQTSTVKAVAPRVASQAELRALAVQLGHPVYWVGSESGRAYELTMTSDARVFVRYLPSGVKAGTKSAGYTFVGTYPFNAPQHALQGLAKNGDVSFSAPGGGLAVYAPSTPTNIYVAFPRSNVEIEVYDPSPKRARSLVASGQVQPVR